MDDVRDQFPTSGAACAETMDRILATHPYVAHLFVYDPAIGLVFRSQPDQANSPAFRPEHDYLYSMFNGWIQVEYWDMEKDLEANGQEGQAVMPFQTGCRAATSTLTSPGKFS